MSYEIIQLLMKLAGKWLCMLFTLCAEVLCVNISVVLGKVSLPLNDYKFNLLRALMPGVAAE